MYMNSDEGISCMSEIPAVGTFETNTSCLIVLVNINF